MLAKCCQMLAKFSGLNLKGPYVSLEKEKRNFCVVLTYSIKRAREIIKEVSCRGRSTTVCTSRDVFANLNLLFFCCSPSPLQKLPVIVIQKFCHHGNVTSHFSSLLFSSYSDLKIKITIVAQLRSQGFCLINWEGKCNRSPFSDFLTTTPGIYSIVRYQEYLLSQPLPRLISARKREKKKHYKVALPLSLDRLLAEKFRHREWLLENWDNQNLDWKVHGGETTRLSINRKRKQIVNHYRYLSRFS